MSFEQVTLGLAITAIILAVLSIVLTVWFFIIQTNDVREAAKERSKFSADMHLLLGEIRGKVYATQEQVNQQFDKLLDAVINRGQQQISKKTTQLIQDVQRFVDEVINKEPRTQQGKDELTKIKERLDNLSASITGIAQSSIAQSSAEIRKIPPFPPHRFYGKVTIDGNPAPNGTPVFVMADSTLWSDGAITLEGRYQLLVLSSAIPTRPKRISFRIGHLLAEQTEVWETGHNTNLDLSARTR